MVLIGDTLAELNASAVRWCLLRDGPELDPHSGDVDLLVHADDLEMLRRLLAECGFTEVRAWGRWPHRFFVAAPLKLDVVTELAFGPDAALRTHVAEAVLARRVLAVPAPRPAAPDAFWALLLHVLLDRGVVRPDRARELAALAPLARGAVSPLRRLVEMACPPGWDAVRIADEAAAGRFKELLGLAPELRARWPGTAPMAGAARAWLRGGLRLASRRLPPRPRQFAQHSGAMTSKSAARSTG
jgi:hypothetical protein